jgi:hypothetical protein
MIYVVLQGFRGIKSLYALALGSAQNKEFLEQALNLTHRINPQQTFCGKEGPRTIQTRRIPA